MMKTEDLISVVVPIFNGERHVKTCLENLLSQSYKNLEIIVIDDGSADDSAKLAKDYPVKVVSLEKNKGLSFARNTGMDLATGKYIHFMDVDDTINTDYYQLLHSSITKTGVEIACSEIKNEARPQKSQRFKAVKVYTKIHDKLEVTYAGKMAFVWRYLFNLDFLQRHSMRFQEGRLIEDIMFTIPAIYYAQKLVVVPKAEYFYRHHENSIMTSKDPVHRKKKHQDWQHATQAMLTFAKKHHFKIPGVNTGKFRYIVKKWIGL